MEDCKGEKRHSKSWYSGEHAMGGKRSQSSPLDQSYERLLGVSEEDEAHRPGEKRRESQLAIDQAADIKNAYQRHSQLVQQASWFIQDAMDNVSRMHPLPTETARKAYLKALAWWPWVVADSMLYCFLTFFERPVWCIGNDKCEQHDLYPTWQALGTPFLAPNICLWIELVLIAGLAYEVWLSIQYQGLIRFMSVRRQKVNFAVVTLLFVDLIWANSTPLNWFRLSPYLRVFAYVIHSHDVRTQLTLMSHILSEFLATAFLLFIYILFFAWMGTMLFPSDSNEGAVYFQDLGEGMWSLLILLTTANFPDVMMPCYNENRLFFLFFFLFVLFGVFFLMNYVTAIVFKFFTDQREQREKENAMAREENLEEAFTILNSEFNTGFLTRDQVLSVFQELNHYQEIFFVESAGQCLLFAILDSSGDNLIQKDEFMKLCSILHLRFEKVDDNTDLEKLFPELASNRLFKNMQSFFTSHFFEWIVDAVLILNMVSLALEDGGFLMGQKTEAAEKTSMGSPFWNSVELVFTIAFTLEALLKICFFGWGNYWRKYRNRFDFLVTLLTLAVTIYVYIPNSFNDPRVIRYVFVFRLVRILRLLGSIGQFRLIFQTFILMMPAAMRLLKTILCVMYMFAFTGIIFFGGVINKDPKSPYYNELLNSDFGSAIYYPNNFNDMASGMVVLFELLVVNNWFEISDGFSVACGKQSRIYFIAFWGVGVVMCLNIVVSFVLDTFTGSMEDQLELTQTPQEKLEMLRQQQQDLRTQLQNTQRELKTTQKEIESGRYRRDSDELLPGEVKIVSQGEALFDASVITGTKTGLVGMYRAMVEADGSHGSGAQCIKQLLTVEEDGETAQYQWVRTRGKSLVIGEELLAARRAAAHAEEQEQEAREGETWESEETTEEQKDGQKRLSLDQQFKRIDQQLSTKSLSLRNDMKKLIDS